jgi:hypothetical protein
VSSSRPDGDSVDTDDGSSKTLVRFWLEYQGNTLELRGGGPVIVGRSSTCHIVLDDGLVSRRHAQFVVNGKLVLVEDFGSVNGVYVNGDRISGQKTLRDQDRVQIGKQDFVLRSATKVVQVDAPERFSAETLHGRQSVPHELIDAEKRDELTRRTDALDLLCGVADKVLALGRGDEAEKLLGTALGNLLKTAQGGVSIAPASAARAATYAVRIADVTGKARWVDYAFELYAAVGRPLPSETVDHLYVALRKISGVAIAGYRAYLERMKLLSSSFSPTERFVQQRIEGLEKLVLR